VHPGEHFVNGSFPDDLHIIRGKFNNSSCSTFSKVGYIKLKFFKVCLIKAPDSFKFKFHLYSNHKEIFTISALLSRAQIIICKRCGISKECQIEGGLFFFNIILLLEY